MGSIDINVYCARNWERQCDFGEHDILYFTYALSYVLIIWEGELVYGCVFMETILNILLTL